MAAGASGLPFPAELSARSHPAVKGLPKEKCRCNRSARGIASHPIPVTTDRRKTSEAVVATNKGQALGSRWSLESTTCATFNKSLFRRMNDYRFPRQYRIRLNKDFDRVFQQRVTAANHSVVVHGCATGLPYPRLGISVPRKIRGAVRRNRWKRLVREAFRLSRTELPPGVDLVVVPRVGVEPKLQDIRQSLLDLSGRIARRFARGAGRGCGKRRNSARHRASLEDRSHH